MDITVIVKLIVAILAAVYTYLLVPYLKTKVKHEKLDELKAYAKVAVQAAEMLYKETGMGQKKKEYVLNYLADKGYIIDDEEINAIIESAVLELKDKLN